MFIFSVNKGSVKQFSSFSPTQSFRLTMACCSSSCSDDGCAERSSEVVKGVHAKLRKKFKEGIHNYEIDLP